MTQRRRRVLGLAVAAGVLVVVGAGAATMLPRQPAHDVAMPPADAAPEDVVRAYLDALGAHDCDTARALGAASFADGSDAWCGDLGSLGVLDVRDAVPDLEDGRVVVPTDIDVDWRWLHDNGSLEEGEHGWSYILARAPGGWRIVDQGNG